LQVPTFSKYVFTKHASTPHVLQLDMNLPNGCITYQANIRTHRNNGLIKHLAFVVASVARMMAKSKLSRPLSSYGTQ
jgi:hypothetical protein